MGGARSEVAPETTRVLMEAANWHGPNLQRTSTAARPAHGGLGAASRSSSLPSRRLKGRSSRPA
jgi:hypothetical protein